MALAACGGDDAPGNDVTPDGCTGHLCGESAKVTDPEGGNIIFEYIYLDTELQAAFGLPAGVTNINRVMAYFMDAQSPNANPLPMPGVCNNLATTKGWPIYVGSPHTDLDVGTLKISGKNEADADFTVDVPKMPAGLDSIQRPHDIFYQTITPNAGASIKANSSYTVAFGGAGAIPATTFPDAIFLSEKFTVNSPGLEDNGPLVAGTDYTVKWTPSTSSNKPANDEILGITWLVDTNGTPTHVCPTLLSAGEFKIPGSAIAEYKQIAIARGTNPNKMILLRNAVDHKLQRLPNAEPTNQRRIDMLSLLCWAQLMDVN